MTVRIPESLARRLGGEVDGARSKRWRSTISARAISAAPSCASCLGSPPAPSSTNFYWARRLRDMHGRRSAGDRRDLAALDPDEESRARARPAAANIIARRKGVTLGGLSIKDLINEGRRRPGHRQPDDAGTAFRG